MENYSFPKTMIEKFIDDIIRENVNIKNYNNNLYIFQQMLDFIKQGSLLNQ